MSVSSLPAPIQTTASSLKGAATEIKQAASSAITKRKYTPSDQVKNALSLNNIKPVGKDAKSILPRVAVVHVGDGETGVSIRVASNSSNRVCIEKGTFIITTKAEQEGGKDETTLVSLKLVMRVLTEEDLKRSKINPRVIELVHSMFEDCSDKFVNKRNSITALKQADKAYQKALRHAKISKKLAKKFIGMIQEGLSGDDEEESEEDSAKYKRAGFNEFKEEYEKLSSAIKDFNKEQKSLTTDKPGK